MIWQGATDHWTILSASLTAGFFLLLVLFNRKPHTTRDPRWKGLRQVWLHSHPSCAVCSTTKHLEVHHIIPVHVDARKELDSSNLITLCETGSHNDHFIFGHLFNWKNWNPSVEADVELWRTKLEVSG